MKMKKAASLLLAVLMTALLLGAVTASAADGYAYTVRVYPGNQGTGSFDDSSVALNENISISVINGEELRVNGTTYIELDNEKYYIKGVRETGKDTAHAESFAVTQDTDLVVAYGVRAGAVQYTVNYVDMNGAPMEGTPGTNTGYGSVGEVIVIGAYPVDGYLPYAYSADGVLVQTYNITNSGGLSANEDENVFTFYYQEIVQPAPVTPNEETNQNQNQNAADTTTPADQTQAADQTQPAAQVPADQTQPAEQAQPGEQPAEQPAEQPGEQPGEDIGDEAVPQAAPQDILDVDVPLADGPGAEGEGEGGAGEGEGGSEGSGGLSKGAVAGITAAVIVAAGGGIFAIVRKKKS